MELPDRKLMALLFNKAKPTEKVDSLKVFTSRPDTIYGVQYIVVAPEHPLISEA